MKSLRSAKPGKDRKRSAARGSARERGQSARVLPPRTREKKGCGTKRGRDTARRYARFRHSNFLTTAVVIVHDVRFWPMADMGCCTAHVRFWGVKRINGPIHLPRSAVGQLN